MARPKRKKEQVPGSASQKGIPTSQMIGSVQSGSSPSGTDAETELERTMLIGERLTLLRKDYERKTGSKKSQNILAREVGLKESSLQRMEDGKGGLIETYATLFNFWLDKGYNLNWIIAKDNSSMSKYRVPEHIHAINAEQMLIEVEGLRDKLVTVTTSFIEEAVDRALGNLLINQHLIGR